MTEISTGSGKHSGPAFRMSINQLSGPLVAVRPEGAKHLWRRIHPDNCR